MSNLSPEEIVQKHKLQMELLMKDSDLKKNQRKKMELELEIRELKRKKIQIESELVVAENHFKETEQNIGMFQNEIIKLRHKLGGVGKQ